METPICVGLLTGGDDKSYALGLTLALAAENVRVEFVGSDKLDAPELHGNPLIKFLNLRGDQNESASKGKKIARILKYYFRLLKYAATTRAPVLHILWNNKFEWFDRIFLMAYYRLCGKKIVLTAHNVNAAKRDGCDDWLNRFSLKIQYRLCDHILVHTEKMKGELAADFGIAAAKVSVIPFGINNTTANTGLTGAQARKNLGLETGEPAMLFFGQIAPYKGLEFLVAALEKIPAKFRLIIAGKVKRGAEDYWSAIRERIRGSKLERQIILRIEHIPDAEVEIYFKAADVVVIPYVHIFQSGVPFLAYSFGLPVIATDVGSLKEDILEGRTGMVCAARDAADLAKTIENYFAGALYRDLDGRRRDIREFANERHSWSMVAKIIKNVYQNLAG